MNLHPYNYTYRSVKIALVLITLFLAVIAFVLFKYQVSVIRKNKFGEIRAIARLKSEEITRWLSERYSDADYFSGSRELKSIIEKFEKDGDRTDMEKSFDRLFLRMKKNHHYADVILSDDKGRILYSIDSSNTFIDSSLIALTGKVWKNQRILMNDFSFNYPEHLIHLDIAAPVHLENGRKAVLIFIIDPSTFLYPLVQSWPARGKSSETLLLRREGNEMLYLNPLKNFPNAALKFKQQLSDKSIPPLDAVYGNKETFDGRDYSGKRVIADIRTIEGTPWFMVAKISKQEIYKELKIRLMLQTFMLILLLLFAASILVLIRRRQTDEEIRRTNAELERRVEVRTEQLIKTNRELESFTYSVSHDLRAPLRAIDGYSALLETDYQPKLDEEGQRMLRVIRKNAQKMGTLIDELLTFSRLGRADLSVTRVDVNILVNAIMKDFTQGRDHIEIKIHNLHPALADASMLRQVWINLISNSFKFSRNSNPIKIDISSEQDSQFVTYCIKDNGAGFDMKYYDKLFGVFQRLHNENEFEGTGVGLAIVQQVIARHGGKVWARSKPAGGSTFYFSLPLHHDTSQMP